MLRFSASLIPLFALIAGPAWAESKTFHLGPFTRAKVDSALTVNFDVGATTQSITADGASAESFKDLRVEVVDGEFRAYMHRDFWDFVSFGAPGITLTVTVPVLTGLEASAASQVTASGMSGRTLVLEGSSAARIVLKDALAETVHISASSASMMALSGSCDAAVVQISSAAMVAGSGLVCVDLTVEASSAARALLFASGEVTASASSGARVELTGNPPHVEDEVGSGADVVVLR